MGVDHEIAYCEEARNEPAKKPTFSRKPESKRERRLGKIYPNPNAFYRKILREEKIIFPWYLLFYSISGTGQIPRYIRILNIINGIRNS